MTVAEREVLEQERFFSKNFYAMDTETNGLRYYEPLQIAIVLYKDG